MVVTRKILRVQDGVVSVAAESRFESEERLQSAIAAHPEVLPAEDFGLGPLVTVAVEVDLGAGPMDLLAVDASGQLVIVEFKRGSENPDVRKVVAQVLDYGSALWRTNLDVLTARCAQLRPGLAAHDLAGHVAAVLGEREEGPFDPAAFEARVQGCLDAGSFVFLYVGRDLDERTRRIMTYLAEGPRMSFFAVEVDYYAAGTGTDRVLVPRTAFVPSWVTQPATAPSRGSAAASWAERLASAPAGTAELITVMDALAAELGFPAATTRLGRVYTGSGNRRIAVFLSSRGVEFNLAGLREQGRGDQADDIITALATITGKPLKARDWPAVAATELHAHWATRSRDIVRTYLSVETSDPARRS